MRKIRCSGKAECSVSFNSRADARSRPNGFSTTIRPRSFRPTEASEFTTVGNADGGIAM
jgi:hypothetical protein